MDKYSLADRRFVVELARDDMLPTTENPVDTDLLIADAHAVFDFKDPGDGGKSFVDLMDALFPNSTGDYTLKFAVHVMRAYCMPR